MIAYRDAPELSHLQPYMAPQDFDALTADAEPLPPIYPTMAAIQARVCDHFHINPIAMASAVRERRWSRPRQLAMYLCRELTPRSLPQIGRAFGNRDHTTVIHACRQIERLKATDPAIAAAVEEITAELSSPREGVAQTQGA